MANIPPKLKTQATPIIEAVWRALWHLLEEGTTATEVIAALEAEGYVIVPVEPTLGMLENRDIDRITIDCARAIHSSELPCARIWRAMIAARPR